MTITAQNVLAENTRQRSSSVYKKLFRRNLRCGRLGTCVDVVDIRRSYSAGAPSLPRRCAYACFHAGCRDAQPISCSLYRLLFRSAIIMSKSLFKQL